jgi:hypothetical protein
MPSSGPPGETVLPDEPTAPTEAFQRPFPGQLDGRNRAWEKPQIGGSRVSAVRFETEQQAVDAARFALRLKSRHGVDTFPVDGVPGALGIRVVQLAGLDLQPPDVGPYADWVYVVYRNTVIEVASSELVAEGVDVKTAQTMLGHSEARLTLDVYAQAVAKLGEAAAEAMGARFLGSAARDGRAMESNSDREPG